MPQKYLFAYIYPLWIFALTSLIVGFWVTLMPWQSTPTSRLPVQIILVIFMAFGLGFFASVLMYMPYAGKVDDPSSILFLGQSFTWGFSSSVVIFELIQNEYTLPWEYRELVWFGRNASTPFDCCCFGALIVPSWIILVLSGIIFWKQLSPTVKIANVLFSSMFLIMLVQYIFPPSY